MASIQHQLLISATAEIIYNALTQQEGLSGWWTPKAIIDAREGIARFPFGENYYKEMKITSPKPYESVSWHCVKATDE